MIIGELVIRDTRCPELGYCKLSDGLWRIVDNSTGNCVGPHYRTQTELLADLNRYARQFGCDD
jgi:hypothetical protein